MKKFVLAILLSPALAFPQVDPLRAKVDSLFIRVSNTQLEYRHLIAPAQQALREMPEAIPYLIEKLGTRVGSEKRVLVDSLLPKMPEALAPLCRATQSPDPVVVRNASEALWKLGDRRATPYLTKVLDCSDLQGRGYAAMGLGKCGGAGAKEGLLKALSDSANFVRIQAAAALGYLNDTSALPVLISALDDPYYGVRFAAVNALAKFRNASLPHLYQALKSDKPTVRQSAAETLGKIQAKESIGRLQTLLKSPLWADRLAAIEALAQIDSPAARRMLSSHVETEALVKTRQEGLLKK